MHSSTRVTRFTLVAALLSATACATISTGVDPMAREAGVTSGARVILYGSKANIDNTKFYQEGASEPLKVVMVNNPTFKQVMSNSFNEMSADARASGQAASTGVGIAYYTTTMRYSPAIFLKQKGAKTIHLVRSDGQKATIVLKPHIGMGYLICDWLLVAPTLGASLFVDMATGKWKKFDNIEIDTYFPSAMSTGSR